MNTITEIKKGTSYGDEFYHECYLNGYITKKERDRLTEEYYQKLEAKHAPLIEAQKKMFGEEVTK